MTRSLAATKKPISRRTEHVFTGGRAASDCLAILSCISNALGFIQLRERVPSDTRHRSRNRENSSCLSASTLVFVFLNSAVFSKASATVSTPLIPNTDTGAVARSTRGTQSTTGVYRRRRKRRLPVTFANEHRFPKIPRVRCVYF